jgi:hypothetical protein
VTARSLNIEREAAVRLRGNLPIRHRPQRKTKIKETKIRIAVPWNLGRVRLHRMGKTPRR